MTERKETLCWLLTEAKKRNTFKIFPKKKCNLWPYLTVFCILGTVQPKVYGGMARLLEISWARTAISKWVEHSQRAIQEDIQNLVICLSKWASSLWEKVTKSQASEHLLPSNSMYDQQRAYSFWVNSECLCGIFLLDIWLKIVTLSCSRNSSCLTSAFQAHGAWFEDQLSKLSSMTEKRDTGWEGRVKSFMATYTVEMTKTKTCTLTKKENIH